MIYHIKLAILVAAICAPIALVRTRQFGERAARWPVAALIPALAVNQVWFLALTAGAAWHFLALKVWHAVRRTTSSYQSGATFSAVAAFGVAAMVTMSLTISNVASIVSADNDAGWARVAATGAAGEYVARFYRGCTEPHVSYAAGRLALIESPPHPDPLACAQATVDLARAARGETFAAAVADTSTSFLRRIYLTPKGQAAIDDMMRR
ncbi:hypothetical protein [Paraburkholderia youngii]|uniref:hypothetical protein n=1 Tax=Paraburkholderia youngii TaxID=2782701 RepID=UPI003D23A563